MCSLPEAETDKATTAVKCSLYDAIQERYSFDPNDLNEGFKNFKLLFMCNDHSKVSEETSEKNLATSPDSARSNNSPRKLSSLNSRAIVLSQKGIDWVGTSEQMAELAEICPNLLELDLSCNSFQNWDEIKKILDTFKNLKFLNLSSNRDLCRPKEEAPLNCLELNQWLNVGSNLSTLILNRCFIDFETIERLLASLSNLHELYLAHNNYTKVDFSQSFVNSKLKVLYFNNNLVDDWHEIVKLGGHFDQLETLVLSENPIDGIKPPAITAESIEPSSAFKSLKYLTMNKININDWNDLERIRKEFASLKHLKIQNIPLLNEIKNDDDKFMLLLAYFGDLIEYLNGSPVTQKERDSSERKFIRFFMNHDKLPKPPRFFELENKHGKLAKLAEVNFDKGMFVNVKIKCGEKNYYEKIDTRQTVGALKTYLEKYAQCKAAQFRLFYIDFEAVHVYGYEELKLMNISLGRFHLKDGDEFEIVLKNSNNQ